MFNLASLLPSSGKRGLHLPGISDNRIDYGGASSFQQAQQGPTLGNLISPLQQDPRQSQPVPEYEKPAGLFGMKGTVRDVIGTLGDALLIHSGRDAMYGPQRRQEKMGEAMHGYQQDPEAAIGRLEAAGYVEQARKIREDLAKRQQAAAEFKLDQNKDKREGAEHRVDHAQSVGELAGSRMAGVNPDNWLARKKLYEDTYENADLEVPYDLPDEFDPEVAKALIRSSLSPKDDLDLRFKNRREDNLTEYRKASIEDKRLRAEIQQQRADTYGEDVASKLEDREDRRNISREDRTSKEKNQNKNRASREKIAAANRGRYKKGDTKVQVNKKTGERRTLTWTGTRWVPESGKK